MSNVGRYTSAELSRELRDAGLSQDDGTYWRDEEDEIHFIKGGIAKVSGARWEISPDAKSIYYARALRLDETLEELTRDRDGGRLIRWYQITTEHDGLRVATIVNFFARLGGKDAPFRQHEIVHEIEVEAAGRCLLALLRERRGA